MSALGLSESNYSARHCFAHAEIAGTREVPCEEDPTSESTPHVSALLGSTECGKAGIRCKHR